MLLSEAFNRYIQDRIVFANKSRKTEESYVYARKSLLSVVAHDLPLSELKFETVRDWKVCMQKRGLSSGTIRGYIVCLRAVLNYMTILKHECLDPKLVLIPERSDPSPSFLTPEEVSRLIRTAGAVRNTPKLIRLRNQLIISLIYSSGIRVEELCSLDRADVTDDVFTVLGKGRKRRPCMIDKRTRKLISEYTKERKDGHPALIYDSYNKRRLTRSGLQAMFRTLSRYFGKPVHPHTLRHSFANDLMRKGCHIYPLSRMMGHSSISTTQIYFQLFDPELKEAHAKYHTV